MATKKNNTVILNGQEFDINKMLSTDYLKKDYQGIPYLEVSVYRDILRQLDVLQEIQYGPIQTIASGVRVYKGKQSKTMTLSQDCFITTTDGKKYQGNGVITASEGALLNDSSSFGVMSRLKARAFKDALKYRAKIFELPTQQGEEMELDNLIKQGEKVEVVNNTPSKTTEKKVDKVKKFEEILEKAQPKTKEEFQKLQVKFAKEYKGNGFTEEEKAKLGELKKIYLSGLAI